MREGERGGGRTSSTRAMHGEGKDRKVKRHIGGGNKNTLFMAFCIFLSIGIFCIIIGLSNRFDFFSTQDDSPVCGTHGFSHSP